MHIKYEINDDDIINQDKFNSMIDDLHIVEIDTSTLNEFNNLDTNKQNSISFELFCNWASKIIIRK